MSINKWSLLVLFCALCFVLVGCEDEKSFPQNRELVIINGTTDRTIDRIGMEAFPFGRRTESSPSYFSFEGSDVLDADEQFAIVLSPYVYRIIVSVRFHTSETDDFGTSRGVTIDLPASSAGPTYITLQPTPDELIPDYILEVGGKYVAHQHPSYV